VWKGYIESDGEREEGEACIADGVGFTMFDLMRDNPMVAGQSGMSREFARFRELVGPNKGILQASTIEDGKSQLLLEATKIEPKPVSASLFEPPPGYEVVDMGEMLEEQMKAMQQMEQNPGD
jgi:hypothetical protein